MPKFTYTFYRARSRAFAYTVRIRPPACMQFFKLFPPKKKEKRIDLTAKTPFCFPSNRRSYGILTENFSLQNKKKEY